MLFVFQCLCCLEAMPRYAYLCNRWFFFGRVQYVNMDSENPTAIFTTESKLPKPAPESVRMVLLRPGQIVQWRRNRESETDPKDNNERRECHGRLVFLLSCINLCLPFFPVWTFKYTQVIWNPLRVFCRSFCHLCELIARQKTKRISEFTDEMRRYALFGVHLGTTECIHSIINIIQFKSASFIPFPNHNIFFCWRQGQIPTCTTALCVSHLEMCWSMQGTSWQNGAMGKTNSWTF